MKKKITLNESKLGRFSAVAGAILAGGAVNAQITYTDVNPDVVIDKNSTPYQLDFNADAASDMVLAVQSSAGTGSFTSSGYTITYTYAGSAAIAQAAPTGGIIGVTSGSGTATFFLPDAMNQDDAIDAAGNFATGGVLGAAGSYSFPAYPGNSGTFSSGAWLGANDKFVGAKFVAGANTHYGWVRLSVAADASTITIKDHAFNTVADEVILAGQMAGLADIAVDNKVSIKTTLESATINVTPDLIGGRIVLVDMSGREMSSVVISDINTTVTFEGLETGIYNVTAQFEAGNVNKRVYVK